MTGFRVRPSLGPPYVRGWTRSARGIGGVGPAPYRPLQAVGPIAGYSAATAWRISTISETSRSMAGPGAGPLDGE